MQTTMTWKVRVLSLVLICLALLALSLLTDISTIGATGRFAWNAVMAALLMSARSFDTVLAYDPGHRDSSGELWVSVFEPVRLWRERKLDVYIGRPLFAGRHVVLASALRVRAKHGAPRLCACGVRGAGGSYPEVDLLHLRILLEVGCLSLEHRASGLQDVGVVGNIQR